MTSNLILLLVAYFSVLLHYPLIRATTTTMFLEAYGAKSTPLGWLLSVLVLSFVVTVMNKLHHRFGMHRLFLGASLFSVLIFLFGFWGHNLAWKPATMGLFIWKEIYIVIQVHLMLGYANSYFSRDDFLRWIGPLGAMGSLGGVVGGLLTSWGVRVFETQGVFLLGLVIIGFSGILGFFTKSVIRQSQDHISPFRSLQDVNVKKYVAYIIALTLLSQFIINIADYKFNLVFEQNILNKDDRTSFLGNLYSLTNFLTLVIQFLLIPIIFKRLPEQKLQLLIPISYLVSLLAGIYLGSGFLWVASGFYLYLKSSDYSLFSGAKELLYQPLKTEQKYGAKYLTDMLSYRLGKALISLLLLSVTKDEILNFLMLTFLLCWIVLIFPLIRIQQKIKNEAL